MGRGWIQGVMNKVTIIGNGGAGKSTLALALGRRTGLPFHHLDQVIWQPDWQAVSEEAFQQAHDDLVAGESWIIEGVGYDSTIADRFARSDAIVYLDFPIAVHFWWAIKRGVKSVFVTPAGWAAGCQPLAKLIPMLRIIWHIHRTTRPYLRSLLARQKRGISIHHLRSPRELKQFYQFYCQGCSE